MKLISVLFIGSLNLSLAAGAAKAWTAASFRTNTADLEEISQPGQPQSGVRHVPGALMIGGGMIIEAAWFNGWRHRRFGAPGGELDDICASAGIEAIEDLIAF